MNDGQMVFSQLMAHGSRFVLDRCIQRHDGNRRVRSFSCRDQYLAMAFAQPFITTCAWSTDSLRNSGVMWARPSTDSTVGGCSNQVLYVLPGPDPTTLPHSSPVA